MFSGIKNNDSELSPVESTERCNELTAPSPVRETQYMGKSVQLSDEHESLIRTNIYTLMNSSIPRTWLIDRGCKAICEEYYWNGLLVFNGTKYRTYRNFLNFELNMYSLIDQTWTASLALKLKEKGVENCLEVAAGNGWLSYALQEHGLNVKATDIRNNQGSVRSNCEVEIIDGVSAIEKYKESYQVLIISYPYPDIAVDFIQAWNAGKPVIYIGFEPKKYQNTAQIDFFNMFKINEIMDIPRWDGYPHLCLIGEKSEGNHQFTLVNEEYKIQGSLRSMLPHDVSDSW